VPWRPHRQFSSFFAGPASPDWPPSFHQTIGISEINSANITPPNDGDAYWDLPTSRADELHISARAPHAVRAHVETESFHLSRGPNRLDHSSRCYRYQVYEQTLQIRRVSRMRQQPTRNDTFRVWKMLATQIRRAPLR
jgi:hypothetical protein